MAMVTFTAADISKLNPEQTLALLNGMVAKVEAKQKLKFKVSEKGALSVYGLNVRFPVTLYVGQWERLIAAIEELKAFIRANNSALARKD